MSHPPTAQGGDGKPKRKTLVQLQTECTVKDPIAHAKRQVSELDRTAKKSEGKRKGVQEQQAAHEKELHHLEQRLSELKGRYEPLCAQLEEKKARRRLLQEAYDKQREEQQKIMEFSKGLVQARLIDDSKVQRRLTAAEMEAQRGYSLRPESTFRQRQRGAGSSTSTSLVRTHK